MADVSFEIVKTVGVLKENKSGWTKELNLISWNGAEPKYDIREWSPDHDKMSRGITLAQSEMDKLLECMSK